MTQQPTRRSGATPAKETLEALSSFRYHLRMFMRFSEDAAAAEGITSLQYQLLLHVCGFPGREWATVGELAERLQSRHHGTVALVSRCEEAGLVERRRDPTDRRQVQVHLLPTGRRHLKRLAALHRGELGALYRAIGQLKDEAEWLEREQERSAG
ncbi:MarR family winged helix-turn-helix transcriptional regulator [Caenimonas terrae]|uniref:MarR family winged helix-turn-helix transcriptional regulator n=1 Tax=Caenimonas terrae TaxID=696074 RepID=A0ABW0N7T6_9BURK